ncbi:MAG: class A beta-lactamase-related serine hydrolase [Chitinophagaceae bacterium]|nr:MAG: class A beta-lactamase-related serine hydrolase [Chitinophagaceae bacterium]
MMHKKISCLFLSVILLLQGITAQSFAPIDSIVNSEISKKNIAGGVCLIIHQGKIVHNTALGFADIAQQKPMTTSSIFRIASQTKAIVSVAFLQLVQQHKIGLDDPIEKYIPAFANQQVAVLKNDSIVLENRKRSITPRDLLSHQSGISSVDEFPQFASLFSAYQLNKPFNTGFESLAEEMQQLAKMPLVHQPGERFSYGLSTNVIGRLIEIVSQKTLDSYLTEMIFAPLKMNDTYFYLPKEKQDRLVKVYAKFIRDSLQEIDGAKYSINYPLQEKRNYFSAIGGLVSTTHDYANFLQCLLNGGVYGNNKRLISSDLLNEFLTNQLGDKTFIFSGKKSLNNFGLGVGLTTPKGSGLNNASAGSFFWGGAFNTAYMVDKKRELITLFYFQVAPFVLPPLLSKLEKTAISIIDAQ